MRAPRAARWSAVNPNDTRMGRLTLVFGATIRYPLFRVRLRRALSGCAARANEFQVRRRGASAVQSLLLIWGTAAATFVWAVALTAFAVAGVRAARRREFSLGAALWGRPHTRVRRVEGREAVVAGWASAAGFGLFAGVAWLAAAKFAAVGLSLAVE